MRWFVGAMMLGMGGCDGGGVDCDDDVRTSVIVTVVDADGQEIVGTGVTYTVDGGAEERAICSADISEGSACPSFLAGAETEGEFVITATFEMEDPNDPLCWFTDTATATVTVEADECHVETEEVTIELDITLVACA